MLCIEEQTLLLIIDIHKYDRYRQVDWSIIIVNIIGIIVDDLDCYLYYYFQCSFCHIIGLIEMITAKFKNRKELGNFVKKDLSGRDIERTDTHIVLITVKEDFRFLDNCKNSKVIQ